MTKIDSLHQEIDRIGYNIDIELLSDFLVEIGIEKVGSVNALSYNLNKIISKKVAYSEIIDKIQEKNDSNKKEDISFLKDTQLEEFSGEVLTVDIDLVGSSEILNTREIMGKVFALTNLFEKIYKDLGIKVFYVEGDRLIFGFFSDGDLNKKVEITKLYLTLLEIFTSKDFHINVFTWDKEVGDGIYSVFRSYIVNTINSKNFDKKVKTIKELNIPNYTDFTLTGIKLGDEHLEKQFSGINVHLHKKITAKSLGKILDLEFFNEKIIRNSIIDLFLNNLQTNNEFRGIKQETIKKGTKLATYGKMEENLYLVIKGKLKIELLGRKEYSKIINEKTIIGEMGINGEPANANVYAKTDIEVIKIPKKIIEDILSGRKNSSLKYSNKLKKLLEIYKRKRNIENIIKDSKTSLIKDNFNIESYKKLIKNLGGKNIKAHDKTIITENQINKHLFVIKKGSKLAITKNGITHHEIIASDMIVGENTFLSYLNTGFYIKTANATVKIIEGKYKKIPFKRIRKEMNNPEYKKTLELFNIARGDTPHIINPNLQKAA